MGQFEKNYFIKYDLFYLQKKKYCDVPVYVMLFPDIKWDCWEKLGEIILLEVFVCVWVGGVATQYLHVNCPLLYVYIYICILYMYLHYGHSIIP